MRSEFERTGLAGWGMIGPKICSNYLDPTSMTSAKSHPSPTFSEATTGAHLWGPRNWHTAAMARTKSSYDWGSSSELRVDEAVGSIGFSVWMLRVASVASGGVVQDVGQEEIVSWDGSVVDQI